ncbi:lysoplasmalogenase family protein [Promethearchaeum syntrophicum]|uniref:Lysoplasmalogenase family protein n=1 Tax=Promethearchaeum syntrophicum TaxID=2594042 RepID=A0A5B9DDI4_9ARCH|nr:lysoplasmalogenase family protein [Candidatus Prometheoarchaeum syntrophicum]QEE16776.1 YhhN-like protein [Candidatus Prometheoarchaeum syntrophicum]
MDKKKTKKSFLKWIVYFIGLAFVILEITRILVLENSTLADNIRYVESILAAVAAVLIRFLVDSEKIISLIKDTDIEKETFTKELNPKRFLNLMPIAAIVCTISDFILGKINPDVIGIGTFLIAQIFLIVAFSGLIHYRSIVKGKIKRLAIISTVILTLLVSILYFLLIFSVDNLLSMIVFLYMICILIMTIGTYFNLGYTKRDIKFRIMLCIGGTSFLVSDAFVGINMFNDPNPITGAWVLLTYNLAIFFLQFAVLFLRNQN